MSSLNRKVKENIYTYEGGRANIISKEEQLKRTVLTCLLWEENSYESGETIASRMEELVKKVDPKVVEQIAIQAKNEMKLRHVPLFLAILLIENGHNVRHLIPQIVNRVDDMGELLAIYRRNDAKKKFSRSLLKGIRDCFPKFNEYSFSKYKGNGKAYKLVDIINLVHPKPDNDIQRQLYNKIVKGTLATSQTWEVGYSACKNDEEKKKVWETLIAEGKLGGLATLRNLRNMQQVNVPKETIQKAIRNIKDPKMLPIDFLKSAQENPAFENEIEERFLELFNHIDEKIEGKTLLLVDVSDSMSNNDCLNEKRAGSLGMIAREMFKDIDIKVFGNDIDDVANRRGFALRDLLKHRNECTYLGKAMKKVNTMNYDRIIVITDEQTSDSVPNPVAKKAYMLNVASNKNGVGYSGGWRHISGWSDAVLKFILEYERNYD
jgi:hypothetical protein